MSTSDRNCKDGVSKYNDGVCELAGKLEKIKTAEDITKKKTLVYRYVPIAVRRAPIIHVTNVRWLNIATLHVKRNIDTNIRKSARNLSGLPLSFMI